MTPVRTRPWFRWSLRTMFVVVTGLCVWLGWNVDRVHKRNAYLGYLELLSRHVNGPETWEINYDPDKLPMGWRWLGAKGPHGYELDHRMSWLMANEELNNAELTKARSLLPDCEIRVLRRGPTH